MPSEKNRAIEGSPAPTGPTYRDIIAGDKHLPPADLLENHRVDFGTGPLARARYTSLEFHGQEREHMWSRVWQLACREEEIPEVGDVLVYELCDISLIIVRSAPDEIKAFYNSCLHRGTKLCASDTSVSRLRCPFHGFTWSLDGQLADVPCRWDFPQIVDEEYRLPEVKVGRWGGFVFVSLDPTASSLEQYLEVLPAHFTGPDDYSNKYIHAYYRKILPCNWKAGQEAFLESYHILETHPQMVDYTSFDGTQYDVFPGARHTNRFLSTIGVANNEVSGPITEQQILDIFLSQMTGANGPPLPEGATARAFLAEMARTETGIQNSVDYSTWSDSHSVDGVQYFLFPNMILFRGFGYPMVYRFRPAGNDPDRCIFDMIVMRDVPAGQSRPEPAPVLEMGDKTFSDLAPGFPSRLGMIYDQDTQTLGYQQQGMKSGGLSTMSLSRYQESRIRHMHQTLDLYLSGEI